MPPGQAPLSLQEAWDSSWEDIRAQPLPQAPSAEAFCCTWSCLWRPPGLGPLQAHRPRPPASEPPRRPLLPASAARLFSARSRLLLLAGNASYPRLCLQSHPLSPQVPHKDCPSRRPQDWLRAAGAPALPPGPWSWCGPGFKRSREKWALSARSVGTGTPSPSA